MVLKPLFKKQNPMSKPVAFKLIVTLSFVQQIIFRILDAAHVLESTDVGLKWSLLRLALSVLADLPFQLPS